VFEFTLDGSAWTQVKDGESIASASVRADGHLLLTRSDGAVLDAGYARGGTGASGVHVGADTPEGGIRNVWIDPAGSAATTDQVAEGSQNLYYTDARVDARIALALADFAASLGASGAASE